MIRRPSVVSDKNAETNDEWVTGEAPLWGDDDPIDRYGN